MRKTVIGALMLSTVALSACAPGNSDLITGAAIGTALGTITAAALSNRTEWIVVGALAGAAAGTLVAESRRNNSCAYSRGDGTYYTARCP